MANAKVRVLNIFDEAGCSTFGLLTLHTRAVMNGELGWRSWGEEWEVGWWLARRRDSAEVKNSCNFLKIILNPEYICKAGLFFFSLPWFKA